MSRSGERTSGAALRIDPDLGKPEPLSLNPLTNSLCHLLKNSLGPPPAPDSLEAAQRLAGLLSAAAASRQQQQDMKVPPISLPSGPFPMPFSPDLLWRCPNPFLQPPPSPLEMQLKTQLPGGLPHDPRSWSREDVNVFVRYCEREFDLDKIDMEKFQMNGKALCLLSKADLAERCPGAGDVIHNILNTLIRETAIPSSPLTPRPLMTPTSPALPLSPHPWPLLTSSASETFPNLSHLISQTNSVTLSPAPSVDSQNGSPKHSEAITSIHQLYPPPASSTTNGQRLTSTSSHSDSEDSNPQELAQRRSPGGGAAPRSPKMDLPSSSKDSPSAETPELNTNGRLLWDFLQQLLNDPQQRYTNYIAWKNKETGVFKIVDPAGLARLWGIQKNHLSMNYDKMSRALRYYYRVNILRKVQGERHCYQFLRNPTELKSIKNISLLRQQMEAQAAAQKMSSSSSGGSSHQRLPSLDDLESPSARFAAAAAASAVAARPTAAEDDQPTDLTMDAEEKASRIRERMERNRIQRDSAEPDRDREQLEPRPTFDFRYLIPQVSIKTE